MAQQPYVNLSLLNKRYREFTNAIQRAYGRYTATYTLMAPTLTNDKDPNQDATCKITAHLPDDPRVRVDDNIPFTDVKGLTVEEMDKHLENRAAKFLKHFKMRTERAVEVENNRKVAEGS